MRDALQPVKSPESDKDKDKDKDKDNSKHPSVSPEGANGATVHFVTNDLDDGPLIIQGKIKIEKDDTADTLKKKVNEIEYSIYPLAIKWYADGLLEQCDHHFLFNWAKIESPIQDISKS